jgi:hypothetical protein
VRWRIGDRLYGITAEVIPGRFTRALPRLSRIRFDAHTIVRGLTLGALRLELYRWAP